VAAANESKKARDKRTLKCHSLFQQEAIRKPSLSKSEQAMTMAMTVSPSYVAPAVGLAAGDVRPRRSDNAGLPGCPRAECLALAFDATKPEGMRHFSQAD